MKWAGHISVRTVQSGPAATLLNMQLLHYGVKVHSLVSRGCILKAHRSMMLCEKLEIHLTIQHRIHGQVHV
jgi:hypothetical protein